MFEKFAMNKAVFNRMSNVLLSAHFTTFIVIGSETSRHSLNQSHLEIKHKPIAICVWFIDTVDNQLNVNWPQRDLSAEVSSVSSGIRSDLTKG